MGVGWKYRHVCTVYIDSLVKHMCCNNNNIYFWSLIYFIAFIFMLLVALLILLFKFYCYIPIVSILLLSYSVVTSEHVVLFGGVTKLIYDGFPPGHRLA
jgi:hypothetical protein